MRIVRLHVETRAKHSNAAIDVSGGIIDESLCNLPRMMPQDLPCGGLDSIGIIRAGNIHDAGDNYGCNFESTRVSAMKDPLRPQLRNVLWRHLAETDVPSTGIVSVVGKPIVLDAFHFEILAGDSHCGV